MDEAATAAPETHAMPIRPCILATELMTASGWLNKPTPRSESARLKSITYEGVFRIDVFQMVSRMQKFSKVEAIAKRVPTTQFAIYQFRKSPILK